LRKLVEETPATKDQDHVPVIVDSVPQIPCRVAAVLDGAASPLPAMQAGLRRLERAGAECVVIACNTAHYWVDQLCASTALPILHIADAVGQELARRKATGPDSGTGGSVGLLATEATLAAEIYPRRLAAAGVTFVVNPPEERAEFVLPAIALVKRGDSRAAGALLAEAIRRLRARGAGACVLACTELPVALEAAHPELLADCIDPTRALAREAVRWALARRAAAAG
ncbi:MAG: aspartate/glutamate racemase family protein, partial [Burkholderiaceae bacterium]